MEGETPTCDVDRSWSYLRNSFAPHARTVDALDSYMGSSVRRVRRNPHPLRYDEAAYSATTPVDLAPIPETYDFIAADRARRRPRRIGHLTRAEFPGTTGELRPRCWSAYPSPSGEYPTSTSHRPTQNSCQGVFDTKSDFSCFNGESCNEDYLDWEQEVEEFFYCDCTPLERQVKHVIRKLTGRASDWWMHLARARRLEGRGDVKTWHKMKRLLRGQFLTLDFEDLLDQQNNIMQPIRVDSKELFIGELTNGESPASTLAHPIRQASTKISADLGLSQRNAVSLTKKSSNEYASYQNFITSDEHLSYPGQYSRNSAKDGIQASNLYLAKAGFSQPLVRSRSWELRREYDVVRDSQVKVVSMNTSNLGNSAIAEMPNQMQKFMSPSNSFAYYSPPIETTDSILSVVSMLNSSLEPKQNFDKVTFDALRLKAGVPVAFEGKLRINEAIVNKVAISSLDGPGVGISSRVQVVPLPDRKPGDSPEFHPINEILHGHNTFKKDLNDITAKAKKIQLSRDFHNLLKFDARLQFIDDVCIFLGIAEDQVNFPAVYRHVSFVQEHTEDENQFNKFRFLIKEIKSAGTTSSTADFYSDICSNLEYLDVESAKLINRDETFLWQFSGRFCLLWSLYRVHRNAEDDIIFPTLESRDSLHTVNHSFTLDHKQEVFKDISEVLSEFLQLHEVLAWKDDKTEVLRNTSWTWKHNEVVTNLQGLCNLIWVTLGPHIFKEELELWPSFDKHFSIEEQDKNVGHIIGTTGAEVLLLMLSWVTSAISQEEQNMVMDMWRQATRNTMFNKWLHKWWKGAPSCSRDKRQNGDFPEGGDCQENFDQNGIVMRSKQDFEGVQVKNIVSTELGESAFPPKPGWRMELLQGF